MSATFDKNDKFGLKTFSEKLEKFLMIENDFVEGGLVVSLTAPFGYGKTTFLSMWKNDIDERRKKDENLPITITLNAWESDYCGDPLLAIVSSLIKSLDEHQQSTQSKVLREAAKDLAWLAVGLANQVAEKLTGVDSIKAGEFAESKKKKKPDFIKLYQEKSEALNKMKEALKQVFGGENPKAFIFVDELDRCRPDYAISYLETIKHVFDIHGMVFVLAVDYHHLSCSARALFGQDLKFEEYFRKFVQRSIALPKLNKNGLHNLASDYALKYLEKEGIRISLMKTGPNLNDNISELVTALNATPRQIQEIFRIIGHAASCSDQNRRGYIYWCIGISLVFMSALKVVEQKLYQLIVEDDRQANLKISKFLIDKLGVDKGRWWLCIYLSGMGMKMDDITQLFQELNLTDRPVNTGEIQQFNSGWGTFGFSDNTTGIRSIYEVIEGANNL